jgi:hypothetical protein
MAKRRITPKPNFSSCLEGRSFGCALFVFGSAAAPPALGATGPAKNNPVFAAG